MKVTLHYTASIEKATRLTQAEMQQWQRDAKLVPKHKAINVDIFYMMLRIQRLVSYCGVVCGVPDTNIMRDFIDEIKWAGLPTINMSVVPVKRSALCRIFTLNEWRPNIIQLYYGKIYDDIHKDPLFNGFQGAIFVQSNHIQDMCMAYDTEVWSDEKYDTPQVRQRRTELKSLLKEINDRDVKCKTASEKMLEVWDDKYESYKKAFNKLANRLNDAYVKMYKNLDHHDAIVAAIFATTYTMSYFYKKTLVVTQRQLETKYNEYRLGNFLDEFGQMAEACKKIRKECDKIIGFNRKEMFDQYQLPEDPGVKNILKEMTRIVQNNEFWQETIGDEKYINE